MLFLGTGDGPTLAPGPFPPYSSGVTATEQAVLDALLELERAASARRASPSAGTPAAGILPLLERLDRLAGELPADTPGDLRHYLQRKSYEKARLFLQGRAAENTRGNCGH